MPTQTDTNEVRCERLGFVREQKFEIWTAARQHLKHGKSTEHITVKNWINKIVYMV